MLTTKVAKALQSTGKRIKSRMKPALSQDEIVKAYSKEVPFSKPKPAIGPKYKRKTK